MKRKILSVFLMFTMVMAVVSCNGNATATSEDPMLYSVDDTQPVILEEGISEEIVSEVESEVESETVSEVAEEDPLAVLEVSEEWARQATGTYLKRDGKLYSLNTAIPVTNSLKYDIGWRASDTTAALYYLIKGSDFISFGDVPVPVLEVGDQVVSYKNTAINLRKAEFLGYSVTAWNSSGDDYYIFTDLDAQHGSIYYTGLKQFQISDGDNIMEPYSLEHNKEYTVSWFVGTDYNEFRMKATGNCYRVAEWSPDIGHAGPDIYDLSGELSKDSCVVYDFSGVAPGIYMIDNKEQATSLGFIEIR